MSRLRGPRWGGQARVLGFIGREERVGIMNKKSVNDLTREWWSVALRGVVALLAGVVMVVSPIPHQSHLLPVFGAYMLTEGIVELITGRGLPAPINPDLRRPRRAFSAFSLDW